MSRERNVRPDLARGRQRGRAENRAVPLHVVRAKLSGLTDNSPGNGGWGMLEIKGHCNRGFYTDSSQAVTPFS